MKVFAAIDDKGGTMFARRRQSQDVVLREHILALTSGGKLLLSAYTAKQFEKHGASNVAVCDDLFAVAGADDFCFAEEQSLALHAGKIDVLYLCKWNRAYPSDKKFDLDLNGFVLKTTTDIKGKSHEKITIEEWIKP